MEGRTSCVWSAAAAAAAVGLVVTAAAAATAATITAAVVFGVSPRTAGGVQWSEKGKEKGQ